MSGSVLHLDAETRSACDLKKSGVYRYAEDPSTQIMCICWAVDDGPVETWVEGNPLPEALLEAIAQADSIRAHNAQFERVLLGSHAGRKLGFPVIPIERWVCTAAKASAHGLPRKLGDAANALGTHRKDDAGYLNMLQLSKPRRGKVKWYTPQTDPVRFKLLYAYCADDVRAERDIDKHVPDLSPYEQRVWELDQQINDRGIAVDLESIAHVEALLAEYKAELAERCHTLTGFKPTQTGQIATWVRENGYRQLTNLQADTVNSALKDPNCPAGVRAVLRIYSTYSMKAVSKYARIRQAVCADGRLRGMFMYHGAGTGRWSSMIVQLQNLFRSVIDDADAAIEAFAARDLDWIRTLFDKDPMKVMASCIRGMFVAGEGKDLLAVDYAGIESRFVAWMFDEEWKVKAFRDFDAGHGFDNYVLAYARSFNIQPKNVTKAQRQVGKPIELGLAYEGGVGAFVTMAATYGVDLNQLTAGAYDRLPKWAMREASEFWIWSCQKGMTHGLPERTFVVCDAIKRVWRRNHPKIVRGWGQLLDAAKSAVQHPGKVFAIPSKKIKFKVEGDWLYMRLPSGRRIAYYKPVIDGTDTLTYLGMDTYTRRWMRVGTYGGRLCENACQGGSRDLLVCGMFNLEAAGIPLIGSVHDEALAEILKGSLDIREVVEIFCKPTDWCADFPLAAEGFLARRYRK